MEHKGNGILSFDDVAERILQLEGKPLVTLKQILEISRIKEDDKTDFNAEYVIQNILTDFEYLHKEFRELSSASGEDATTMGFADEQVAKLEKDIWMLKAHF